MCQRSVVGGAPRRGEEQIVSVGDQSGVGASVGADDRAPGLGPPESGEKRPFGVVVASTVTGFRSLLRQHVELAKIESTEAATVRAKGAGMMAGAGVMALYALGFAAAAGAAGLAVVLPTWAAILIVAAVFVAAALVLVLVGRGAMRSAPKVERTRETLKEDVRWAKQQMAR